MDTGQVWDFIITNEIADTTTLSIITRINGYNVDTLNDVIYVVTGYRNMEQYLEEE